MKKAESHGNFGFTISFSGKKTGGTEVPPAIPRFGRNASDYDLHEMAGGLPLTILTAPNVHHRSKQGREVCKPMGKSNVPIIKCGSKRTHYAPSRKYLLVMLRPLLRKENP